MIPPATFPNTGPGTAEHPSAAPAPEGTAQPATPAAPAEPQAAPQPEHAAKPEAAPRHEASPAPAPQRGGGFGGALAGGIIAAALGFFIAWFFLGRDDAAEQAQADRLDAIEQQLAELPPPADLQPLTDQVDAAQQASETALADLGTSVSSQIDEITARLGDLETRVTDLEGEPSEDGTLTETAIARWQDEVDALRQDFQSRAESLETDLRSQLDDLQAQADAAEERLQETRETAQQVTQDAEAAAARSAARAALEQLRADLDTGSAYAQPLNTISEAEVAIPEGLSDHAEDGVPMIAALREDFEPAAREALSAARLAGEAGEDGGSRVGSFLRSQLQVRSTGPRTGDDADAVLSRAQDALRQGRLQDALSEVEGLPQAARDEMSGWIEAARIRAGATAAADDLAASLNEE
ncbi:COG4223 family protein [Pseudoroseicyclus aestuarii]|uniref:Inner membrane protein n=1 Tax=Pseudoroseicyclus aestuarii TaxID=1795041 RepID=A0A318SRR1_9RHOB|nr:mitofilin family membrane protein [Pseudoroseicyclus aestuarii]PYE84621.1 inner membrane protein [Pseudoroseicyclus aestuarii]